MLGIPLLKRMALILGVPLLIGGGCATRTVDEDRFAKDLGATSITVFPTFVRIGRSGRFDAESAARIAALWTDRKWATTTLDLAEPPLLGEWHMNQAAMWSQSLQAFGDYVRTHPIQTEYACMAEFLKGDERGPAGGIHFYVVTRDGKRAWGLLLNSHHKTFANARPATPPDCTNVLLNVMAHELAPSHSGEN